MKRWTLRLLLLGCAVAACATSLQAGELLDRMRRERDKYPPRYTRASMSQWYIYRDRNGQVQHRQTYPGYEDHFPPPAYLYYGYPHSGNFSGLGIDGSP